MCKRIFLLRYIYSQYTFGLRLLFVAGQRTLKTGLFYAVEAFEGKQCRLAGAFNLTPAAMRNWRLNGIPPKYCLTLNREHGLKLHKLNPDVYPPELFGGVE